MANPVVYTLCCPVSQRVMYVGKSIEPAYRFEQHIQEARLGVQSPKCDWIRELATGGLTPSMEVIEECTDDTVMQRETYWIEYHRQINPELTNGDFRPKPKPKSDKKLIVTMLRFDPELHERMQEAAKRENRSLNNWLTVIAKKEVEKQEEKELS